VKKLKEYFSLYPRKLILVDFSGALISAFMLGIVLVHWNSFFGIPVYALYVLAVIPCFFALYGLSIYAVESANARAFLKNIAYLNLTYCIFSAAVAVFYASRIKAAGWIYLGAEILIVLFLARLEMLVASSERKPSDREIHQ
jgi:hypothetical protein